MKKSINIAVHAHVTGLQDSVTAIAENSFVNNVVSQYSFYMLLSNVD